MVGIQDFCSRLVNDFIFYFGNKRNLLTQSIESCKTIIKECIAIEPDYVVEIGTNYGLSTLSLAYGLKILGKDESALTTTDIFHNLWLNETPEVQKGLLLNSTLKINRIGLLSHIKILLQTRQETSTHRLI